MKHFTTTLISAVLIWCLLGCSIPVEAAAEASNSTETTTIVNELPEDEKEYTSEELAELISEQEARMEAAHVMAEAARDLGYSESHDVITLAQEEYMEADALRRKYQAKLKAQQEEDKWAEKEAEYPEATYVWKYLTSYGYSDVVAAGILGNIMVEVGGNTLAINSSLSSSTYSGMCQWSTRYYPQAIGLDLEGQCELLTDTIQGEFKSFASLYQKGFSYESFLQLTDPKDAALAFSKVYERCGSGSYARRQSCAAVAYAYFTS